MLEMRGARRRSCLAAQNEPGDESNASNYRDQEGPDRQLCPSMRHVEGPAYASAVADEESRVIDTAVRPQAVPMSGILPQVLEEQWIADRLTRRLRLSRLASAEIPKTRQRRSRCVAKHALSRLEIYNGGHLVDESQHLLHLGRDPLGIDVPIGAKVVVLEALPRRGAGQHE